MIMFFDTETTGFFQDKLPVDDPAQPYIVQIAAELCDDDGRSISGFSFIVDPGISNGVLIPEKAAAVHGITNERAALLGVSIEFALNAFTHLYQRANLIVAHNVKFDRGVIEAAIARHYKKVMPLRKALFCTMEAATPIMKMPPTARMKEYGIDRPKPPKLEEAIRFFFDESLDGSHDAMVDVIACRRIYFHMKREGAIQ